MYQKGLYITADVCVETDNADVYDKIGHEFLHPQMMRVADLYHNMKLMAWLAVRECQRMANGHIDNNAFIVVWAYDAYTHEPMQLHIFYAETLLRLGI